MSNDHEDSETTSQPDTPTGPSQPQPSTEDDDIETPHFPHEYEALYESHTEESANSYDNDALYHENES